MLQGVAEAPGQRLGGEAGRPGDPVDLVGQGGVEDAGVVGADDEVHAGVEEAVHGVQLRAGDAAEAQVGAGAGLDDHAQVGQLAEDELLAPPHLLEAVVVVGPPAEGRGVAPAQALALRLQVRWGHLHAGVLQGPAVAQVVGDLVQPLGHRLPQVGAAPPLHGDLRVQAQGDAVAQALRPELGGLVTPAHGALQGLVEVDLAHVVEDLESVLRLGVIVGPESPEEAAHALGRVAFLDVAEVDAGHDLGQFRPVRQEPAQQAVRRQRRGARQGGHVARLEAAAPHLPHDLGVGAVELDEARQVARAAEVGPHLHVADAAAAVVLQGPAHDLPAAAGDMLHVVAADADQQTELGAEPREVGAVLLGEDEVPAQLLHGGGVTTGGAAEHGLRVGAPAVGGLESLHVRGPVDVAGAAVGHLDQVLHRQAAAGMDVQLAALQRGQGVGHGREDRPPPEPGQAGAGAPRGIPSGTMEYRRMGRAGLKVSEICLGTMTFGHGADEEESRRIVDLAVDRGVNFFDTANTYAGSLSEEYLGRALEGRRRDHVIATKFFNPMGPGPNDSGMSRVHVMNAVEDSLRRLRTDYVDLCYIHHVDVQTPMEEMLRALEDLVRQGKVRYPACSNYPAWRLMECLWISDHNGWSRFECYQPQYSLVVRDIEQELIPLCLHKGLGVVVWSPLGGGFLTGKYRPGERVAAGTRSEEDWAYPARYFAAGADRTLEALLEVAGELERAPAEVAVRWVLGAARDHVGDLRRPQRRAAG